MSNGEGGGIPITLMQSAIIRWAAGAMLPAISFLFHATGLDVKLHLVSITENSVFNGLMFLVAAACFVGILWRRVKMGADPANLNVAPIKPPADVAAVARLTDENIDRGGKR